MREIRYVYGALLVFIAVFIVFPAKTYSAATVSPLVIAQLNNPCVIEAVDRVVAEESLTYGRLHRARMMCIITIKQKDHAAKDSDLQEAQRRALTRKER